MQGRSSEAVELLKGVLRAKQIEFGEDSSEALETSRELEQLSTDPNKRIENDLVRLQLEEP